MKTWRQSLIHSRHRHTVIYPKRLKSSIPLPIGLEIGHPPAVGVDYVANGEISGSTENRSTVIQAVATDSTDRRVPAPVKENLLKICFQFWLPNEL
jgi:hypothetical protein